MKRRVNIVLVFLVLGICSAHAQLICYQYDAAGNRINRLASQCTAFIVAPPSDDEIAEAVGTKINPSSAETRDVPVTGKVVPNPTNTTFDILLSTEAPTGAIYELYDALGRAMAKQAAMGLSASFNVSSISPGVCYLFLKLEGKVIGKWTVVKQ